MRSMKFYEIRTTLPARGGITGDGNVLSKFSQMPMCYFGVLKDILSSLRKPGPRDCYYFCSCLGVSTFQIGRQGFSSRAGNSSALLPSTFQPEATTSKTALPPAALQVSRAVAFVPLICLFKRKATSLRLTPFWQDYAAYLTWWDVFLHLFPNDRDNLPLTETSNLSCVFSCRGTTPAALWIYVLSHFCIA